MDFWALLQPGPFSFFLPCKLFPFACYYIATQLTSYTNHPVAWWLEHLLSAVLCQEHLIFSLMIIQKLFTVHSAGLYPGRGWMTPPPPPKIAGGPHFAGYHNLFPHNPGLECRKSALFEALLIQSLPGEQVCGPPPEAKHLWCPYNDVWTGPLFDKCHPPPYPRGWVLAWFVTRGYLWGWLGTAALKSQ